MKATSLKHMIHSRISDGAEAVRKVKRRGKKMSCQYIEDVYFMQKSAEVIDAGYLI